MTEADTSRVERPCPNCGVTLNGWSGLRHCGHYTTHAHADCINNLRHRAEKAEVSLSQMRDAVAEIEGFPEDWPTHGNIPLAIVAGYSLHKSGREEAEAERDTAWNDAIEAAAKRNSLTVRSIKEALDMRDWDAARKIAMKGPSGIRSLRKGDQP